MTLSSNCECTCSPHVANNKPTHDDNTTHKLVRSLLLLCLFGGWTLARKDRLVLFQSFLLRTLIATGSTSVSKPNCAACIPNFMSDMRHHVWSWIANAVTSNGAMRIRRVAFQNSRFVCLGLSPFKPKHTIVYELASCTNCTTHWKYHNAFK